MFTGIIEETGTVESIRKLGEGREFVIRCSFAGETHVDESICVNGACMTVVDSSDETFSVQVVPESLRKTTFSALEEASSVNLERSLTMEKAMEGHMVQGHVDTTGLVSRIRKDGEDRLIDVEYDQVYEPYVVGRGSISVNGVSLTIAHDEKASFTVAIIPYTWTYTTFKDLKEGDRVNLEFDIFGKYIVKYLDHRFGKSDQ